VRSCCERSDSSVLESRFQPDTLAYTYIVGCIYPIFSSDLRKIRLEPDLTQRNCCVSRGRPVQGCNSSPSNVPLRVGFHVCNIQVNQPTRCSN
jgi:hypothetical protein